MSPKLWLFIVILVVGVPLSAQDKKLVLMTHDSFSMSEALFNEFERETGITVEILRSGDAGSMVNQAILTKDTPLADVLYGIDNTFLSRALENDLFVAYESPELANIDATFITPDDYRVTPVDFGDVCLNYDIAYFEDQQLALPQSFDDLLKAEYSGLLVTMNPATSSPGLAFLLATIAQYGTDGDENYLTYWQALLANDALIVEDWETAYFGYFTGASDGDYPLVVSYASSPPFSIDEATQLATTASIVADGMCFRQIEYVGILQGTANTEYAQQWIDFMLSKAFQEELPMQMYVFPVRKDAELPQEFAEFAQLPEKPAQVLAQDIEANRDEWIRLWIETILR
jgi:thiamine transport system substrate-binding protein